MIQEVTITTKSGEKYQTVIEPLTAGQWATLLESEIIILEKNVENADLYDTPDILIVNRNEIESIELNEAEEET